MTVAPHSLSMVGVYCISLGFPVHLLLTSCSLPARLGVDAGTSALKDVVFDRHGAELFSTTQTYRLAKPQPGWVELDLDEVWCALLRVLRDVGAITGGQVRSAG
jgi:glycerol kinase